MYYVLGEIVTLFLFVLTGARVRQWKFQVFWRHALDPPTAPRGGVDFSVPSGLLGLSERFVHVGIL